MKIFCLYLTLFLSFFSHIESSLPADITFLIVDYKYSKDNGVKICEVQTANVSNFKPSSIVYNENNRVYKRFCSFISQFQKNIWSSVPDLSVRGFIEVCKNNNWTVLDHTRKIFKDPAFIEASKKGVNNPSSLTDYHGAIFSRFSRLDSIEKLQKKYPGILVIDASIFPYQNNKLKMSKLLDSNPELAKYRPKWKVYPKKYSKNLSKQVANDFNHSRVVIKPHRSTLGKGVIIVDSDKLDRTLSLILKKNTKKLRKTRDASYQYWLSDTEDSFLVEEYIHSDPVTIEHLDNNTYDPTYRASFVLYYHNEAMNIHFIEHLTKLPEKSLTAKGTLNEKHKTILKQPFYAKVADENKIEFESALTHPLLKMYELLLNQVSID